MYFLVVNIKLLTYF